MDKKYWPILLTISALIFLAGNVGVTSGSHLDAEKASNNTIGVVASTLWRQTTQADFNGGRLSQVDISTSPGHIKLAATGGFDRIFTIRGTGTNFYNFNVTDGSWSPPRTTGTGGAIVYDGSGYLYAFQGSSDTGFWKYDLTANTWTALADTPANVTAGGSLARGGPNYIYAFKGGGTAFWRYSIVSNSWSTLAVAPVSVAAGGALAWDGSNYVYAF